MVNDDELVDAARAARARAWAPYSHFAVGAAVRTESGRVYTGVNVESASYPLTCCAERVAIYKAVSEGDARITAVAVVTDTSPPAHPCGGCRQVIFEFGPDALVTSASVDGEAVTQSIRELLPGAFDGSALR